MRGEKAREIRSLLYSRYPETAKYGLRIYRKVKSWYKQSGITDVGVFLRQVESGIYGMLNQFRAEKARVDMLGMRERIFEAARKEPKDNPVRRSWFTRILDFFRSMFRRVA